MAQFGLVFNFQLLHLIAPRLKLQTYSPAGSADEWRSPRQLETFALVDISFEEKSKIMVKLCSL
jgi:hypothetical protein